MTSRATYCHRRCSTSARTVVSRRRLKVCSRRASGGRQSPVFEDRRSPDRGLTPLARRDDRRLRACKNKVMPLFYDLVASSTVRTGTVVVLALTTRIQDEVSSQSIQTTIRVGGAWIMISVERRMRRVEVRVAGDSPLLSANARSRMPSARGYTLVEILVVILIILIVSAVALPTILPALAQRQVSEGARLLQAALVGARDRAIHESQPCGIRLLADPAFPINWTMSGCIDPTGILAYNRWVPLESAPEYTDGLCTPVPPAAVARNDGWPYPITNQVVFSWTHAILPQLVLAQSPANPGNGMPNAPTSWFWNVRVGDKVQLNGTGPWYTVVGPMLIAPAQGNSDLFVNAGLPAPLSRLPVPTINGQPVEYLTLVNALDDNLNGWVDESFDGVDNDGNGLIDDVLEWEFESWAGAVASQTLVNVPYTIRRRPFPAPNGHEVSLPTSVVIDATTALLTQERSRLPVNRYTGQVNIVLNPDGTVVPTVIYSAPSSFAMGDAFYHFWLADRSDLAQRQPARRGRRLHRCCRSPRRTESPRASIRVPGSWEAMVS